MNLNLITAHLANVFGQTRISRHPGAAVQGPQPPTEANRSVAKPTYQRPIEQPQPRFGKFSPTYLRICDEASRSRAAQMPIGSEVIAARTQYQKATFTQSSTDLALPKPLSGHKIPRTHNKNGLNPIGSEVIAARRRIQAAATSQPPATAVFSKPTTGYQGTRAYNTKEVRDILVGPPRCFFLPPKPNKKAELAPASLPKDHLAAGSAAIIKAPVKSIAINKPRHNVYPSSMAHVGGSRCAPQSIHHHSSSDYFPTTRYLSKDDRIPEKRRGETCRDHTHAGANVSRNHIKISRHVETARGPSSSHVRHRTSTEIDAAWEEVNTVIADILRPIGVEEVLQCYLCFERRIGAMAYYQHMCTHI